MVDFVVEHEVDCREQCGGFLVDVCLQAFDELQRNRLQRGELGGVKASGGVRTAEDVLKMAQAGANRIGASASVAIVTGTADGKAKGY